MPNSQKAARFLRLFSPTGYLNLVAIHPFTKEVIGLTRHTLSPDIILFLEKYIYTHNLYFMVNEPFPESPDNKLKKSDVAYIHALYIDADPDRIKDFDSERTRLRQKMDNLNTGENPPSYIVDSGGGYQAFWLLNKPILTDDVQQVEEYGRGLAHLLGTDAVQNIDRIMRIPFTTNYPTALKAQYGRVKTDSTVIHASQRVYSWETLKTLAAPLAAPIYDNSSDDFDMDSLNDEMDIDLKIRWYELLQSDQKLQKLVSKEIKKPSRSEYDFAIMQRLKMDNWNIHDAAQALYCCDAGKGKELTAREISRAYGRVDNPLEGMALPEEEVHRIDAQFNPRIPPKPSREYKEAGEVSWRKSGIPLLKGLIDLGTTVAFYGQSNVGKSFVVTDLAGHIALGKDWAGHKLKGGKAGVYIVAAEAGATYGKRVDALKVRLGLEENVSFKDFPFAIHDNHINLIEKDENGKFLGVEKILTQVGIMESESGVPCKLIVIDTLSAVFGGGNENSSDDMGLMMDNLLQLAKRSGATVLIVHHSGKDQAAGLRGHTKLIGALDSSFEVKMSQVGDRMKREIFARKQRDNEKDGSIEFNLNVIELGLDSDGDAVTSCNILLRSDSEFSPVIVDKLGHLTDGQLAAYKTVQMCQTMSYCDKATFNGWYEYLKNNPNVSIETIGNGGNNDGNGHGNGGNVFANNAPFTAESLGNGHGNGFAPLPIKNYLGRGTLHKQLLHLAFLGLILENEEKQWVTTED